jgi:hypothetical protein
MEVEGQRKGEGKSIIARVLEFNWHGHCDLGQIIYTL